MVMNFDLQENRKEIEFEFGPDDIETTNMSLSGRMGGHTRPQRKPPSSQTVYYMTNALGQRQTD